LLVIIEGSIEIDFAFPVELLVPELVIFGKFRKVSEIVSFIYCLKGSEMLATNNETHHSPCSSSSSALEYVSLTTSSDSLVCFDSVSSS
jgi:hypothetical protein